MSKDDKYRLVLSNLDSNSTSKVHHALSYIRAKFIKEKGGVEKLCRLNVVNILLRLLQIEEDGDNQSEIGDTFWKQADLCLSILSNMCMEKCARNAVKNISNSISTLVVLLEDQERESINNRTIRALANLALDPSICDQIVKTLAVDHVVEYMNSTEDKESLKTCCRALRLFGHSDKNRDKIAIIVGIYPVARLLKHEDKDLMEYGLRSLSELSRKCTLECACQIQNAGVVDKIVELAEEEGKWNNNNFAIKIFMNLMEQPNARASVGSSGGIAFVLRLLQEEQSQTKRLPLLNALCLFCRESVNRVRIREKGILDIFAKALQDKSLFVLHARIISALVCFVYDEKGLKHLLSLKLVDILLNHLQTFAEFSFSINLSLRNCTEIQQHLKRDNETIETGSRKRQLDSPEKLDIPGKKVCGSTEVEEDLFTECFQAEVKDTKAVEGITNRPKLKKIIEELPMEDLCVVENSKDHPSNLCLKTDKNDTNSYKLLEESRLVNDNEMFEIAAMEEGFGTGLLKDRENPNTMDIDTVKEQAHDDQPRAQHRNHVYSLDSPTYEAQYSEWSLEDFRSSVKCKQSFSPDSLSQRSGSPSKLSIGSSPLYMEPVSPLSIPSHYSPDYSPQYSPLKVAYLSPASSPGRASTSSYLGSPQRSISLSDFSDTPGVDIGAVVTGAGFWEYSSDEDCSVTESSDAGQKRQTEGSTVTDCTNTAKDAVLDESTAGKPISESYVQSDEVMGKDMAIKTDTRQVCVNETPVPWALISRPEIKGITANINKKDLDNTTYTLKTDTILDSHSDTSRNASSLESYVCISDIPETAKNVKCTSDTLKTVRNLGTTSDTSKTARIVEHDSDTPKNAGNATLISAVSKTARIVEPNSDTPKTAGNATLISDVSKTARIVEPNSDTPKTAGNATLISDVSKTARIVEPNSDTPKTAGNATLISDVSKTARIVEHKSDTPKTDRYFYSGTLRSSSGIDKKESLRKTTIDNILILFSRVSQMPDPRALVSEQFICCLLDYVTIAKNSSPRASRILQRLVRNPMCLENLLDVLTPVYIVQKIHKDRLPEALSRSTGTKMGNHLFRMRSGSSSDVDDLDESTDAVGSEDGNVNDALLKDLSFVVESSYGRGTIAHILKRKPQGQKFRCLLCLPFLLRNFTAQQKTLFQDGALQQLLNPKLILSSVDFVRTTLLGLQFLSAFGDLQLKLPSTEQSFPIEETGRNSSINCIKCLKDQQPIDINLKLPDCFYASYQCEHDLLFVLEEDIKLTGRKSVLVVVSQVFQAMLLGDYSESKQSQIRIPHISAEAFLFLLHFLHGCDVTCKVIDAVVCGKCSISAFFDVITLADRYLLEDLQDYLVCLARQKYLNFSTLKRLYHFSMLHSEVLAEDCLRFILTEEAELKERVFVFKDLLSGSTADLTLEHIRQVLKRHTYR